ncbi:MAG: saccharopine dehydrogenase NADP-binding domain-containing protein, partial [Lutibacter sp.]|nr:saccharopine dehydrogenase NADP-binding domain-containing protein [Lutibacter sp.]
MKKILLIGAGRSSSSLITYLLQKSYTENLHLTIADVSLDLAKNILQNHENGIAIVLDIFNTKERQKAIKNADIVISMLPAHLHLNVAKDCLTFGKSMVTASYISEEMKALNDEAIKKNLIFMNEIGLDPGVDHMSAMKIIDDIKEKGGKMLLFESFTGGLV